MINKYKLIGGIEMCQYLQKSAIEIIQIKQQFSKTIMGNCECNNSQEQFPDLNKMTMSKISTGENFLQKNEPSRLQMGRSVFVSESMVKSRLHKIASNEDHRIDSKFVKTTYKNLPATDASRFRDLMVPEEQLYIQALDAKFVGEVVDGKPHGYGKLYFKNQDLLQGSFLNGRCQGKGRFIKSDGSYYDGDFKNNVADGYGIYVGKKGFRYEGQWKNNVPNGQGEATYPDGSRYVGEFFNNKKNGKGTLYQAGNVYRGDFVNDHFEGKVRYEGQNGDTYDGDWKQSKKHGYGVYSWADGSVYRGQYENGKRQGKGTMTYPSGEIYDGDWMEGQKHGKGRISSQKQNFVGLWKNGNLTGVVDE